MSKKSFALTGVSAALLSLSVAHTAMAANETETVYVSATRSEGPQMPVATQITVIDSEQIRLSGATTITEVLRTQAGIQIQDSDGSGGRNVSIAMRGFSATAINNTLVLVDGRRLNNPTLAGPALNTIALKDIERVEIIQGSAGVLYGDQAVGGVINVITRKAKAGEINGAVTAEAGSYNLENYSANVNQGFENGLSYSLSAQKRLADNFRDNNDSDITNVLGNVGYDFGRGKVFVEQQRIQDDLRLAGSLTDADTVIDPRQTKTLNDFASQDTDLTRVGGEVELVEGWKLIAEYSDRDETGNYFYYDFNFASAYDMRVKNITPRIIGNIATANGDSVITAGYDKVDADYSTQDGFNNINQQVDGIYAQIIYPLSKKLSVTGGVRHSTVDDENFVTNKSNSDDLNSTELGLNYQIDSAWRVFARFADGFRFANADENVLTNTGDFLNAQTSKSYEGGFAWSEKAATVQYSIYHMNIENEIAFDSFNFVNLNLPDSERQGFMFNGDLALSEQVSLRGNYTYTDATLSAGNFDGNEVPFVAKHTANVGLAFNFVKNVSAVFDANYVGSRYRVGDDANAFSSVDAVTLFNFNILWDVRNVELGFRIKNITSESYSDYQGLYGQYPQPGRTYNARVSYRF